MSKRLQSPELDISEPTLFDDITVEPELIDQFERNQIRSRFDTALFVEAGAGTGKTTELVRRVVEVIASGRAHIGEIVAITFTEAAAGELRERIRQGLESVVADDGAPRQRRQLSSAALTEIDDAAIQTVHAFAQRLLQLHPTEVGLPPVFVVRDSVQARLAFDERWRDFLNATIASSNPLSDEIDRLLRTALALGVNTRQLRALAEQLERRWHDLPAFLAGDRLPVVESPNVGNLVEQLVHLSELRSSCTDHSDLMFERLGQMQAWQQRLNAALAVGSEYSLIEALLDAPKFTRAGRKGSWPEGVHDEIKSLLSLLQEEREALLAPQRESVLDGLLHALSRDAVDAAKRRRKAGELEFHDLLVLARDLIRDHAGIRRSVSEKFRFILVDEFQDTDPLQAELVELLTATTGNGNPRFTVGDPKQSIYRFRQADPTQYAKLRNQSVGVTQLSTNFRTLPSVVDWVNETFEQLLAVSVRGDWHPLIAGREAVDGVVGTVTLFGEAVPKKSVNSPALRVIEAGEVAQRILDVVGSASVHEGSSHHRLARFSDVAVLMPTRTGLPALERAFRLANVPYRIESRSLVWSTQEVRDVLAILTAVDDPTNDTAVVASLRSPAFGCGDDDLVAWRRSGGTWNYARSADETVGSSPVVADAFDSLRELHHLRWWKSPAEIVQLIIESRSMYQLAFGQPRQREAWNRLRFILDRARSWVEDGGSGLRAFVAWVTTQMDEGADALESVVSEADDNAVRVLTVHASKGLEFPVVFLTGLNSTRNRAETARILWSASGRPEARIGRADLAWQTPGFLDAEVEDRADEAEEQRRLLYVGATRARDHLFVSVHHIETSVKAKSTPCLAAQLIAVSPDHSHLQWVAGVHSGGSSDVGLASVAAVHDSSATGTERRRVALSNGARPVALAATTIASRLSGSYFERSASDEGSRSDSAPSSEERLAFGRAVHRVLEIVDFDRIEGVEELAQFAAGVEGVESRALDVERSVEMALASEPLVEAITSGRWWKEVFVANTVGDTVIEGFIDLLYETSDGLVVVDYKTDAVTDRAALDAAVDHYRWQLYTYVSALESSLGKPVARAGLVFISPAGDEAVTAWVTKPDSVASELQIRVDRILGA